MKAWKLRPIVTCLRCKRDRHHAGRGLCHSCHVLTGLDGTRDQYPRTVRRREDTVDDYEFLRGQGLGHDEIAAQLKLTPHHLSSLMRTEMSSR